MDVLDNNSIVDAEGNALGGPALGDGALAGPTYTIDDHLYYEGGSSGYWNANWAIGSLDGAIETTWIPGSDAIFPDGTVSVTIVGSVTADSVTFLGADSTLQGGTIAFGSAGGTIDVEGNSASVSSIITGSCLAKMGPGSLTLSGVNAMSSTQIGQGTLHIGNSSALGLGGLDMCYGGTLDLNGYSSFAVTSLSGDGGTITDESGGGGVTTFVIDQSGATQFDGDVADGPYRQLSLVMEGGGSLTLGGANTFSGTTSIDTGCGGGSITIANPNALQNSTLAGDLSGFQFGIMLTSAVVGGLSGSGSLAIDGVDLSVGNNNQATEFAGNISGWGSVTKIGSGALTVTGASTYTGGTAVAAGVFDVAGSIVGPVTTTGGDLVGISAPAAPTGFTTTLVSDSEVDLQWMADPANLSGFQIQQSSDGGTTWLQSPVSVAAGVTACAMSGLSTSQDNYIFEIQAVNVSGVVGPTATLDVLASPTLTADSDTQVTVALAAIARQRGQLRLAAKRRRRLFLDHREHDRGGDDQRLDQHHRSRSERRHDLRIPTHGYAFRWCVGRERRGCRDHAASGAERPDRRLHLRRRDRAYVAG